MKGINNVRIGVKVQIATIAIIVLCAVVSVAAIALRTILTAQVGTTVAATEAALQINGLSDLVKQYMAGTRPFAALQQDYDAYQNTMKTRYGQVLSQKVSIKDAAAGTNTTASLEKHVTKIWQEVGQAEALRQENLKIEADVVASSNESISKSNGFLSSVSERLSDPIQQRKVSILERKVIQGASLNTNSGFTIQLLFKDMKLGLANKDKLFQYLDLAEKNATADVQRLAGTDFAQLPKDALAAIGKTRELATRYTQNEASREGIAAQVAGDLASLVGALNGNLAENTRASFARITDIINTALILFAIFVALVVAMQVLISRSITKPLNKGVGFAQIVANGDFTQHLDIMQKDETGILAKALNDMSVKLKDMVSIVQENAEQIASSSEEISASAQKLAEGAQVQASSLEETSASVEEEVSENLTGISDLAKASVEGAIAGAKAVQQVVDGINRIAASSEKIGGIVNVISDIADQTNLLSLNASIEAARAGEHGRGFAVVADEVSKLADRSAASTKEIESLIRESSKNVTDGVKTAQGAQTTMEQIRGGAQKAKEMIGSLSESMTQQVVAVQQLSAALTNVSEMSQSISAATEEQSANAKQVSKAVENVNEITQSAASSAEQMSSATEQLSNMAQELQRLMGQFKIEGDGTERKRVADRTPESEIGNGSGKARLDKVAVGASR